VRRRENRTKEARTAAARKAARFRWVPDSARKLREWYEMVRGLNPSSGIVSMGETWIDDMILNDPRMHKLGANPTARLLYYESYIWSDREASGGIIDDVVLLGLCRGFEREALADVEALVRVGLWERRGSGYYIIDFIESGHATRTERVAKARKIKEERRKAGKKGAATRWQKDGKPDGKPSSEMANAWQDPEF
jgi:hypothetical protein